MASLWKRQNSPYWACCYTAPDGQRLKKSTKQSDRRSAWAVCLAWEQAALKGREGMLTEAQARKVVSEIVEKTTGEPIAFQSVNDWLKDWLAGKAKTKANTTFERYTHVIDDFLDHLGNRAKLNLVHISHKDVRAFRDVEQGKGKSGKTCNLAVKTIAAAFNAAKRQGFITHNPCEALEPLPHEAAEKGWFTPEQVIALLQAAPSEDWYGIILLDYYTGMRLEDAANVRWSALDLADKVVRFKPEKRIRGQPRKEIVIPMHPDLGDFLLQHAGHANTQAFLFPSLAERKTGGEHGLSRRFAEIMQKAGITEEEARPKKEGKGRRVSRLSFHSLRHSFNSALANRGVPQEIRQKFTGHSSANMNANYTHHEMETLRQAVSVLPSLKTAPRGQ